MKHLIDPGPSRRGWHRLQTVLQCPRLYALKYKAEKSASEMAPAEALIKGSLIHIGIAHHYALQMDKWKGKEDQLFSPADAVLELAEQQPTGHRAVWLNYVDQVQEVLTAYQLHWQSENWITRAVEHELLVHVFDDERDESILYTQRVDAIWEHPITGKIFYVDHKSAKNWSGRSLGQYSISGQMLGYAMIGQKKYGDRWGGVLLNVIQWPKTSKPCEFSRTPVEPAPYAIANFKSTILHAEQTIHNYAEREPMDWPGVFHSGACWNYGPCRFLSNCQWGGSK
jgi:hypothetical protein